MSVNFRCRCADMFLMQRHIAEARGEGSAKESLPLFHKHDSQEVPEQKTKDHSHNCRDDSNLAVACARTVCEVHISALIVV